MTTLQYLRKVLVLVGGEGENNALDVSEFRVQFRIERGDTQTPNSADVRIFNLSDAAVKKITSSEFTRVVIQAGYEGNFGLLFDGQIKQARSGRLDARDSYVDVTAADGDEAYNYSTLAISLAAGAKPEDPLQEFIRSMALGAITQGYTPNLSTNGLTRGRVYYGLTRDELRDWAETQDVLWSIQDGKLTLIPKTSYVPGEIPVVSPSTGLIGVPEQTPNGTHVRVLLNPSLKIGQAFRLDSTINQSRVVLGSNGQATQEFAKTNVNKVNADGLYYVMSAAHVGDTRGEDFYSDLTCLAVDATVPLGAAANGAVQPEAASIRRY